MPVSFDGNKLLNFNYKLNCPSYRVINKNSMGILTYLVDTTMDMISLCFNSTLSLGTKCKCLETGKTYLYFPLGYPHNNTILPIRILDTNESIDDFNDDGISHDEIKGKYYCLFPLGGWVCLDADTADFDLFLGQYPFLTIDKNFFISWQKKGKNIGVFEYSNG